jgi:hypothetical protein
MAQDGGEDALQQRLATRRPEPGAPATLVGFELLATDPIYVAQQQRRARLEPLLGPPRPVWR